MRNQARSSRSNVTPLFAWPPLTKVIQNDWRCSVRLGWPIYPFLSNFVIVELIETALDDLQDVGVELGNGEKLCELDYEDDFVVYMIVGDSRRMCSVNNGLESVS